MFWVVLILICAFLTALRDIFAKTCLKKEHTVPSLFWICYFIVLFSLLLPNVAVVVSAKMTLLIIIGAVLSGFAYYFLYHALRKMEVSFVAPLMNISPIFLIIMSFFILGEELSWLQYLGILITIFGAYLLELKNPKKLFEPFKLFKNRRYLLLIVGLVLYSICAIIDKYVLRSINFSTYLFYSYLYMALFYIIFLIINGQIVLLMKTLKRDLFPILGVAAAGVSSELLYLYVVAMPAVAISLIVPIKRVSGLFTTILAGRFLHENGILHKAIACCIIILGLFMLAV